jgi:tetratricopeptide (TPR) repeat protein
VRRSAALAALALGCAVASGGAAAAGPRPDVPARLRGAGRPDLARSWAEARSLERRARGLQVDQAEQAVEVYLGAAQLFEAVLRERPGLVSACWRGARVFWLAGDTLPLDAKERRLEYFGRAETLARRGLDLDPECAECMLWLFSAMGRLRTTRGVWTGLRQLPEMAALLERGIALQPTSADDEDNSTLGNLHYASAIFYRILPDWFWLGWLLGVKGDKQKALEHIRAALALHPSRLDYRVELGSQLLCLGTARRDRARLASGMAALRETVVREPESQDQARELAAARIMLRAPEKSCGYSGDTWVEIDRHEALRAARAAQR